MTATYAPIDRAASEFRTATRVGMVQGQVRTWLRLEGLAAFGVGLALFWLSGGNWLFFVPLLLVTHGMIFAPLFSHARHSAFCSHPHANALCATSE